MAENPRLMTLITAVLEGRLTDQEGRELADLLRNDPQARRLYVQHCMMDGMLREEDDLLAPFEAGSESSDVAPLPVAELADVPGGPVVPAWRAPVRYAVFGLACAAAGVAAALFVARPLFVPDSQIADRIDAPPAEAKILVRETRLSDGSTVQLAPQSSIALRYSESERALDLEGGEAHFAVAHDEARPFVVAAGAIRVRAVGTAFDVRRVRARVVVTVIEGKVEMARSGDAAATGAFGAIVVPAGSRVVWDDETPRSAPVLAAVEPSRALSWREGRLEYVREPLWAVVADLNRYSERPVEIADAKLRNLHVTTTVHTDSIREWLTGLPGTLPVGVEFENGRTVIVDVAAR